MDYKSHLSGIKRLWISLSGHTIGQNKLLWITPVLEITCPKDFIMCVSK